MPKPLSLLTAVFTAFTALAVTGVTSDWKEYTDNELHVAFFNCFKYVGNRHIALLSWGSKREEFSASHSVSMNHAQRKYPINHWHTKS